jgi:hypothetical protein
MDDGSSTISWNCKKLHTFGSMNVPGRFPEYSGGALEDGALQSHQTLPATEEDSTIWELKGDVSTDMSNA